MQNVSNYEDVRADITRYARAYIHWCRARDQSYAEIGKRLGVSHSWVKQLDADEHETRRIGGEVELALARLLHGGSVDSLRNIARLISQGVYVHVVENLSGEVIELPLRDSVSIPAAKRLQAK